MASDDVLESARNHAADFGRLDRVFREYHLAEAHLIAALAAEIRELRRQRDRSGVCDACTEYEMQIAKLRRDRERLMWALSNDAEVFSMQRPGEQGRTHWLSWRDPEDKDLSGKLLGSQYDGSESELIEIIDDAMNFES